MASPFKGCIAAGHPRTAEAGRDILRAGGNAVDAAVSAACMSFVAEPVLTGAGGGGFMLLASPGRKPLLLDGFARMPAADIRHLPDPDFKAIPVDFGDTVQTFHIGRASVATPGLMSMLFSAQQRFGRIPMREVLAPAMHAARHGVRLDALQASFLHLLTPILTSTPESLALHGTGDALLNEGEDFTNPELANLLELLCLEGVDEMYHGDVARSIAAACRPGGMLDLPDLAKAAVVEREPIAIEVLQGRLLTNPPPSSGGSLIAFSLLMLEALDGRTNIPRPALITECLREAAAARSADFDEQVHRPGFTDAFLHPERIARHADALLQRFETRTPRRLDEAGNRHGSTTHISVLDGDGMAVSMTSSNGEGSGIVVPGTGIHLNNMLGEEDINPLGFHRLKAGQTLSSMMAPSILMRDGKPALILGSGGSNRLRGAILQVLLRHGIGGEALEQAVHAPRLHPEGDVLDAEPGALHASDENGLRALGWLIRRWSEPSIYFGGVHAISLGEHGRVEAAGDPRRGGAVAWA